MHELALRSARQIEIAHEHVSGIVAAIVVAIAWFTIASLSPILVSIANIIVARAIADRG